MKNLFFLIFIIGIFVCGVITPFAEDVTLTVSATNGVTNLSAVVSLASNEVAHVVHTKLESNNESESPSTYSELLVTIGNSTFRYNAHSITNSAIGLPVIAGPANLRLSAGIPAGANSVKALCTIAIKRVGDIAQPSTAVVVPADSGGPVEIMLESSVDLVTWTAALPGTYGTSTQKRFFRVRSVR